MLTVFLNFLRLVEQFSRALLVFIGVNAMFVTALICIVALLNPASIMKLLTQ